MAQAHYDAVAVGKTLDDITSGLERVLTGIASLRALLSPKDAAAIVFNPKDPANKYEIGGLEKLTERGIEICYRLFDAGKSRYAVSELMDISFGAANHRFKTWEKAGGLNRVKKPLD